MFHEPFRSAASRLETLRLLTKQPVPEDVLLKIPAEARAMVEQLLHPDAAKRPTTTRLMDQIPPAIGEATLKQFISRLSQQPPSIQCLRAMATLRDKLYASRENESESYYLNPFLSRSLSLISYLSAKESGTNLLSRGPWPLLGNSFCFFSGSPPSLKTSVASDAFKAFFDEEEASAIHTILPHTAPGFISSSLDRRAYQVAILRDSVWQLMEKTFRYRQRMCLMHLHLSFFVRACGATAVNLNQLRADVGQCKCV